MRREGTGMSSPAVGRRCHVAGGTFAMGSTGFYAEEGPVRSVEVGPFWIDAAPVTNREFATFVEATGYCTRAERGADPAAYRGFVRPEPSAAVFRLPPPGTDLTVASWWELVAGAHWAAPEGPGSDLHGRAEHPVVQVSHEDAEAYAAWRGGRLPTEAEWEYAARGGLDGAAYAWGDEARPGGRVPAVVWPGDFPEVPHGAGWGTAPVGGHPSNGYGLHDMIGNVWEWTSQVPRDVAATSCCASADPLAIGPSERVAKGGSFLCADNYCHRYRPAAWIALGRDSASANVGFRCAGTTGVRE